MRFMVNTIVDHIMAKVLEGSAVIRIVLPSYPPEVLYNVAVGLRVVSSLRQNQIEWHTQQTQQRVDEQG